MEAKILRKWGLKAVDTKDVSDPGSPTSITSANSPTTPVDYHALRAWLPPVPHFERQKLAPTILLELKQACAVILKETTPEDADLDQTDPLEEYKKSVARVDKATTRKPVGTRPENQQQQQQKKESSQTKKRYKTYDDDSAGIGVASTTHRAEHILSDSHIATQDFPPFPQPPRRIESNGRASATRNADYYRPKPHQAASTDYVTDSPQNSGPISRVTTAYASHPLQTDRSSMSNSTHQPSRESRQRVSTGRSAEAKFREGLGIRPSSSHTPLTNPGWVSHERTQQEEDIQVLPQLHKASSSASLRRTSGLRSRAESIRDNIRDYVRPASRSSSRPATSRSNYTPTSGFDMSRPESSARPESRGSIASTGHGRSWWRGAAGALRRKGSFTSFRSSNNSSTTNLHEPVSPTKEATPDTNKSLPPMPSLDTYVEPKIHISQLMVPVGPPPPQNSMTSPAEIPTPKEMRSAPALQTSLANSSSHPNLGSATSPTYGMKRSTKSPALAPARESTSNRRRTFSKPKHDTDVHPEEYSTNGLYQRPDTGPDQTVRTFYSPAHQHAANDLVQFSDDWRNEMIRKDDERRRRQELAHLRRKEEKKRKMEAEKRRMDAENRRSTPGKGGREKMPGLKNRLSKMFGGGGGGAAAHVRASPPSQQPLMPEGTGMEGKRGEVTVAH